MPQKAENTKQPTLTDYFERLVAEIASNYDAKGSLAELRRDSIQQLRDRFVGEVTVKWLINRVIDQAVEMRKLEERLANLETN